MAGPTLRYTVLRLGIFALTAIVLAWIGARGWLLIGLSAILSILISLVALRGLRDQMALSIQERIDGRLADGSRKPRRPDVDADAEDDVTR